MLRRIQSATKRAAMANRKPKNPFIVVLGATGTGKSQLAVDLAKRFNGEVINADAVQMYAGMPIITNKISLDEQQGVPHHLLGCIELDEEPWRVGLFKMQAERIIKEIRSRGRLPILVGGTHYYTQTLLFDENLVEESIDGEAEVQSDLTQEEISDTFPILDGPTKDMIERLKQVDPVMANRWHPKDRRKIRRSLEIFLLTGKKASEIYAMQQQRKSLNSAALDAGKVKDVLVDRREMLLFWVHAEPETLKKRLDARIDKMLAAGLLNEAETMDIYIRNQDKVGKKVDRSRGIWVSIGWKEFEHYLAALKSETTPPAEIQRLYELSIEHTKTATRHYAKQQLRWIRLKLLSALSEDGSLERLYLLDGSDLTQFSGKVSQPAIDITDDFLAGERLVPPHEMCAAAAQLLAPESKTEEPTDVHFRQECEICHIVAVTDVQWQTHLKSRRHRAMIKKKKKNEARGRSSIRPDNSKTGSEIS